MMLKPAREEPYGERGWIMAKVSTQLLLNRPDKERLMAIALSAEQLQAEMLRRMVEEILPAYEERYAARLEELYALLDGMKVNRFQALDAMLKAKLGISELYAADGAPRKRFPLPLAPEGKAKA
jgi:hypothetical protein